MKTITRTYKNKYGITTTYTYDSNLYGKQSTKTRNADILITKAGKVYADRLADFYDQLSISDRAEAMHIVRRLRAEGERVTGRRVTSIMATDQREKMLINAGYTVAQGVRMLGVSELEYFDDANWETGSIFVNPFTKQRFKYNFNYTGDALWILL